MLGDQAFEPRQAGVPEQVWTDLALLEVGQENAVHALRQPPGKVGLSHAERQLSDVLAVADQLEDVELNLVIVPARPSANVPNPVAVEQLQGFVQPLPTPPHPAEALSFPSSHHMAPNLLLYPVLNEAKALAGISNREVVHPTA